MNPNPAKISVNDIVLDVPDRPIAVICIDGCADEYLSVSMAQDRMPHLQRMAAEGYRGMVRAALPSFTNVNNCAIVTGTPPNQTGIAGNYILDPETGEEVMTNSSKFLRNESILAAASQAGRKVAMVTAKDKLRELLSKNMDGIAFSAEKADEVTEKVNGILDAVVRIGPTPPIYSAEASLYVLRAGVKLLQQGRADFLYLSLTDYMQHKFPPEAPESLDFYAAIDEEIGRLIELGAIVGATADHGMNAKCRADGSINVIYLETELEKQFGPGYRVICPITDPYVVHHGALGGAVNVYLPKGVEGSAIGRWIFDLPGVAEVHDREAAASKLELPADRIGDLFVMSTRDAVIGRTPEHHDLSKLDGSLRSHGGRYEEMVPMLLSEPLNDRYQAKAAGDPRNFEIFDFVCNGTRPNN
ncbi:MAG: Phosphonoacetate hydrolase [Candidatus Moanabacter tarae]|uniref:Phosphonoacetate hydrolase n=1 Tax=Candidatus Moanibacter tarae TaxID=2200854 RepID=A0A2Z4AI98_9BACT|nr:MAG: Phosphonoacetate hydrolase [Candidatus Moanabacter tarae]|tara:strand:- start:7545 stop:8789 length:1245 start_codon:yes stop_codon:yes gene_type:complete